MMTDALLNGRKVNDLGAIIFEWWFCGRNRGTLVLRTACRRVGLSIRVLCRFVRLITDVYNGIGSDEICI